MTQSPDPRFEKLLEALEEIRSLVKITYLTQSLQEVALIGEMADAALAEAQKPLTEVVGMDRSCLNGAAYTMERHYAGTEVVGKGLRQLAAMLEPKMEKK